MNGVQNKQWEEKWQAFNNTDDSSTIGYCVHRLVEVAVNRSWDQIALICGDTRLTFGDLDARANQVANCLLIHGFKKGDIVAVALQRSPTLLAVLFAVLKAGGAFVPLDPSFPMDRLSHVLNDASPKFLLVDSGTQESLKSWQGWSPILNGYDIVFIPTTPAAISSIAYSQQRTC